MAFDATDEGRHVPRDDPDWCEVVSLDLVDPTEVIGLSIGCAFFASTHRCWFWTTLVGSGRRCTTIVEPDVGWPRAFELRAPGLWVDLQCLVPFDHVTVDLEAFAVALDDPADALGALRGERVPFGCELDWDTTSATDASAALAIDAGYELACRVHGVVLVGEERMEVDGFGSRRHQWGPVSPWRIPWSRTVTASGIRDGCPEHELVADAPLLIGGPAHRSVRLDRSLVVVHHAARGASPELAWIERNLSC